MTQEQKSELDRMRALDARQRGIELKGGRVAGFRICRVIAQLREPGDGECRQAPRAIANVDAGYAKCRCAVKCRSERCDVCFPADEGEARLQDSVWSERFVVAQSG